jgi:hypothetical protein
LDLAQKTLAIFFVFWGLSLGKTEAGDFSFDSSALRFSAQSEDISLRKRIGKSLLLPGLGEFSLGENRRGRFFVKSEMGLWFLLAGSLWSASGNNSRLNAYATRFANADMSGKDDQFYVNLSTYDSMDAYNAYQQRARSPYETYSEEAGYDWSWDSEGHRLKYRDYLINRDYAKSIASFTIAGMILNRIVSAIDVVGLTQKKVLDAEVKQTSNGAELRLNLRF